MAAGVTWGKNTVLGGTASTSTTPGATSGFSFGGTTPSTPTTTAAPSTTGLFGNTTAPAPSTSAFSFGSPTPAPAASTSLFGTPKPATPASTTSIFGSTTPTASTAFSQQPQPQQQLQPLQYAATPAQAALQAKIHAQQLQEASRIEAALARINTAYSSAPPQPTASAPVPPDNSVPFQHIFYEPINPQQLQNPAHQNPAYPPRPTYIEPHTWAEALARNPDPDTLQPLSVLGAESLSTRLSQQQAKANTYKEATKQLWDTLETLQKSHQSNQERIQYFQLMEVQIRQKILGVLRKVEILRCRNIPIQPGERELYGKLSQVATQMRESLEELRKVQDMANMYLQQKQKEIDSRGIMTLEAGSLQTFSEQDRKYLSIVLKEQSTGLERLMKIMKKNSRDAEIMKQECLPK